MFLHYSNIIYESKSDIVQGDLKLDMKLLFEKKDALLKSVTKVVVKQCSAFDLIERKGKLIAPHKVEVNGEIIEGKYIIMGSGSSAFVPKGIARNGKKIIISDDVLELKNFQKTLRYMAQEA